MVVYAQSRSRLDSMGQTDNNAADFVSAEPGLDQSTQADDLGEWAWVTNLPLAASRHTQAHALGQNEPSHVNASLSYEPRDTALSAVHISSQQFGTLQSVARQFVKDHRRLLAHQEELVSMRSQNSYERLGCMERHRHLSETQHEFSTMLSVTDKHCTNEFGTLELNRLRQQMQGDFEALQLYDARTRASEAELARKELHVREKESALAGLGDRLIQEMRRLDLAYDNYEPDVDDDRSSHATPRMLSLRAARPHLPAVLEVYYDKAGEVNWKRERVHGLMYELRQARVDRLLAEDHGDEIEVSDTVFETDYAEKLLTAQNALDLALEELDRAKDNCARQGLDPNFNYLSDDFEELESSAGDDNPPEVVKHSTRLFPDREKSSSPMLMPQSAPLPANFLHLSHRPRRGTEQAKNRTAEWIQSIDPFLQNQTESASVEPERKEDPTSSWLSPLPYSGQEPSRDDMRDQQRLGRTLGACVGLERSNSEPDMHKRKLVDDKPRLKRPFSESELRAAQRNTTLQPQFLHPSKVTPM